MTQFYDNLQRFSSPTTQKTLLSVFGFLIRYNGLANSTEFAALANGSQTALPFQLDYRRVFVIKTLPTFANA
jgi:hypothetical protein